MQDLMYNLRSSARLTTKLTAIYFINVAIIQGCKFIHLLMRTVLQQDLRALHVNVSF